MASSTTRLLTALAATALLASAAALPALAAGPVSVTLNGNPLTLDPAPTERAGRVFVPLRGVFENLGATVVYANGTINATGRGHTVSLKVGSQTAIVDGQQQTVDVAPFIIGASTFVPLRFVSQALGASVNYDGTNQIVALGTHGGDGDRPGRQVITPEPSARRGAITLENVVPGRGAEVTSRRPTIEARFGGGTVDPNTVRITVDGLDVTNDSTRSTTGILFAPRSPLQPGRHTVHVTGTDANGAAFDRGWDFTSGTSADLAGEISGIRPSDGATVGNQFVVSGRTTPGARVTIQVGVGNAGGRGTLGGIIGSLLGGGAQSNSAQYTVTADGDGGFSQQVSIGAPSGSQLVLAVLATDPRNGSSGTPVQETLTVR